MKDLINERTFKKILTLAVAKKKACFCIFMVWCGGHGHAVVWCVVGVDVVWWTWAWCGLVGCGMCLMRCSVGLNCIYTIYFPVTK